MPGFRTDDIESRIISLRASRDYLAEVSDFWSPLKPTEVFLTYWYFAAARQQMYFRRLEQQEPPWTSNPILSSYRFTNAYRASDRISQYLIRRVLYPEQEQFDPSSENIFFRILLFKFFNKIETWELLERSLGDISWSSYSFETCDTLLTDAMERGKTIFSAAYIMPSGKSSFGDLRKHRNYLRLLEWMMSDNAPAKLKACRSLKGVFEALRGYPLMGQFLAFQYTIDINYSLLLEFDEAEFVVAGPGALNGIGKCFSNPHIYSPEKIIMLMVERQYEEFARLGVLFDTLWGRSLQPIDCQNLFCEVDKYARVAHPSTLGADGRSRIKQLFRPANTKPLATPFYPPKWKINDDIAIWLENHKEKTTLL